jgi:hypothetical protein
MRWRDSARVGARAGIGRQGNARQYKQAHASACAASKTNGVVPASACIFHDVTRRDIDLPCGQNCNGLFFNCFGASGSTIIGERCSSNSKNETAYRATVGYNLATGLGSVGVTKLFNAWAQLH